MGIEKLPEVCDIIAPLLRDAQSISRDVFSEDPRLQACIAKSSNSFPNFINLLSEAVSDACLSCTDYKKGSCSDFQKTAQEIIRINEGLEKSMEKILPLHKVFDDIKSKYDNSRRIQLPEFGEESIYI